MSHFMRLECCVIVCLHVHFLICRHEEHRWSLSCLPNLLCAHVPARPAWRSRTSKSRCLHVQGKSTFSDSSLPDPRSRILISSFCFADCPSLKAIFPGWQNVPTSTMRMLTLALCRWGFYGKCSPAEGHDHSGLTGMCSLGSWLWSWFHWWQIIHHVEIRAAV